MSADSTPHISPAIADRIAEIRVEIEWQTTYGIAERIARLEEQLEALREAVKWVLHTDVWIDDNPFHGPTLEPTGTSKTQVWDNLQAAYDAVSSPAKERQ